MLTILAFIVGMLLLVTVHEWGHYAVARWCGVAVRRFSIGFGSPLWRWQRDAQSTEFVIARWPLGGYVRMVDEADGDVPDELRPYAFNRQPVSRRMAIVCAGPVANVLLAILLYAAVQWVGSERPLPILPTPVPQSMAAQAGLQSGDHVVRVRRSEAQEWVDVPSMDGLWWEVAQAHSKRARLLLGVKRNTYAAEQSVELDFSQADPNGLDSKAIEDIGLLGVWMPPVVKSTVPNGAAALAGVQEGDWVESINGQSIQDAQHLRQSIAQFAPIDGAPQAQSWVVRRAQSLVRLSVTPKLQETPDGVVSRVGVYLGGEVQTQWVQSGLWEGLIQGYEKTWSVAALSLRTLFMMLVGDASVTQLSGPVTVAKAAGQSAAIGWIQYLQFLGFLSVSLAVINALPIPMLDGGHVMYYLWEMVTGRAASPEWVAHGQKLGMAAIGLLMVVALSNDLTRLIG